MGDLVLPKLATMPLVFVAGGIGMASYASMLRDLLARKEERPVFLFYWLRSRREQICKDLTDAYPLQLKDIYEMISGLQKAIGVNEAFEKLSIEKKILRLHAQLVDAAKRAGVSLPSH